MFRKRRLKIEKVRAELQEQQDDEAELEVEEQHMQRSVERRSHVRSSAQYIFFPYNFITYDYYMIYFMELLAVINNNLSVVDIISNYY